MTKSTRIILITAGVLVGLGLIIAGVALGINKIKHNIFGFSNTSSASSYEEKSVEIRDDFDNIDITEVSSDVNIVATSKSNAYVEYTDSDTYYHDITVKGNTLKIEYKNDTGTFHNIGFVLPFFGYGNDEETFPVTLYLPEKEYGELNIALVSGDTSIDPMSFEKISIESVSGEVNVKGCDLEDDFHASAVSGSVTADKLTADDVNISTTSGTITLSDTTAKDTDINTVSGDIKLNSFSASSVDIDTTSGSITLDAFESKDTDISTVSGDIYGTLKGDYNVSFDTVSGDSDIAKSVSGGNRFEVDTTSGDLTLK